MPKKKEPVVLHGTKGEVYFMNRAAKKKALRLKSKGVHVPMQTVSGTIKVPGQKKISAWSKVK